MNLNDRLNLALASQKLRPHTPAQKQIIPAKKAVAAPKQKIYPTLESGIRAAKNVEPDDFGTRIILVETVNKIDHLPEAETIVGKYMIDDIQKRSDGSYEVHLIEKN